MLSTAKKNSLIIRKILNKYYPNPKIPLEHKNLFTLAIAVLLSAQTTDKKVNEVTKILFKIAFAPDKMVKLPLKTLETILRPLGLYQRKAKAVLSLSKILIEKYSSKLPNSFNDLEKLPGIGHKTASVIIIYGFNKPAFPVDTHVFRLAKRWKLSNGKNVKEVEKDLKEIFPKKLWHKIHLQMVLFGRNYCKAKSHDETKCPVCCKI